MTTFAIGDIHGCYDELVKLLDLIQFDDANDSLWFVGDLVNRGTQSLAVLEFVKNLKCEKHITLGNHDLHLLAIAYGNQQLKTKDTFHDILNSSCRDELLYWLRHQSFLHFDEKLNVVMVHAGIYPLWNFDQAKQYANELESLFHSNRLESFLKNMYGNDPVLWKESLTGTIRYRFFVNTFTRMRYCFSDGSLELKTTCPITEKPSDLIPWFQFNDRKPFSQKIVFGHWASLHGETSDENIIALDTGCVWNKKLTAIRLEDMRRFSVNRNYSALCHSKLRKTHSNAANSKEK